MKQEAVKKESYLVEGMSCSGCERSIQKIVSSLQGVKSATADLASASFSVEYDAAQINIDTIKSAVNKLGYKIAGKKAPEEGGEER